MRALGAALIAALGSRHSIAPVNFVLVTAKASNGAAVEFGFTDYGEDFTVSVVDGLTGLERPAAYNGDDAPIAKIDPIPLKIGLGVTTTQVTLNPLHPAVALMARGHDIRNAPVQIHRGVLDRESMTLVAPPRARLIGAVNGAPIDTGAIGGVSSLVLKIVSNTRELTRTNTAMWSDESQRRRNGDRIMRYADNTAQIPVFWGEKAR